MLSEDSRQLNNIIVYIIKILILFYTLSVPFGGVFRPEGVNSPSTLINLSFLTYIIMFISFFAAISEVYLKSNVIINSLFVLSIYLLINTLLFSDEIITNLAKYINFLANILLVFFISNIKFKASFLNLIFYTLSLGSLISSTITIIDYFNIVDIPYYNENTIGVIGYEVRSGSGPFISRSTMGAFYSIAMPISLFSFILLKRPIYLISFTASFIAMIITFNRGAPFALIIVATIFLIRNKSLNITVFTNIVLIFLIVIVVISFTFSDEQKEAMTHLFLSSVNIEEKDDLLADSDNFRIDALEQIITENLLDNPLGHGFNDFYIKGDNKPISVHSNFNFIIYATGFFGFFWLVFFGINLYKKTITLKSNVFVIIKYSLFSWALYSLTHMVIFTYLAWLFLGLLFNRHIKNDILKSTNY